MRKALVFAVLLLVARIAGAADVDGRVLLSFQKYDLGALEQSGFRQTYDLRLDQTLTGTSIVRFLFRGDDFRGSSDTPITTPQDTRVRQLQPIGELLLNTDTFRVLARTDYLDTQSTISDRDSSRAIQRTSGQLVWSPVNLPRVTVLGQRMAVDDSGGLTDLTEDHATALVEYEWHGLSASTEGRYTSSVDPRAGYDRTTNSYGASLGYTAAPMNGRLAVAAEAEGRMTDLEERATATGATVPVPVPLARTLFGVDDTPGDDRDHPLSPYPALKDGNVNAPAGISIGPESVSFQNLAFDIGRNENVDEIRVVVRDAEGNPLRTGGGPVTWDAYSSEDGSIWTPIASATSTYNASLALYSVTFPMMEARWLKVVNFGVNVEATFVTELQAYYHAAVGPGGSRTGTQQLVNATTAVTYRATKALTLSYSGIYTSLLQKLSDRADTKSDSIEHLGGIEYAFTRSITGRAQYIRRDVTSFGGADTADVISTFVDYKPAPQLRLSLELTRQSQSLRGAGNTIDTRAVHAYGQVFRSWSINFDAGTETQTIDADASTSQRVFVNLTSGAQLFRPLRLQFTASMQKVSTDSTDPAVLLLGPARDDRVAAEFIWRAGRPLLVSTRVGWVSSTAVSGFTQRLRVEWYPFADGTVSLGGSYDEDIDPVFDRRARRLVFNPRWTMNRWATFDLNYTAVSSAFADMTNEQRTLFATLTLTR